MISVDNLTVSFGGWDLFKDISFLINPKDRIGLVGKNGAGKSTMLKVLTGEQPPSSGGVSRNGDCTIGYLPQQMKVADTTTLYAETEAAFGEVIDLEKEIAHLTEQITVRTDYESKEYETLLHRLNDCNDRFQILGGLNREAEIEKTLLGLGFKRSDFTRATSEFSGGWRMRIELAKLLLRRPSLFLLDEPTNHLDIASREWIEEAVEAFDGTLLFVSHDRYFINRFATRVWELEEQRITDYPMGFARYRKIKAEQPTKKAEPEKTVKEKNLTEKPPRGNKNQQAARRQLTICEREIAQQEEALAALDARLEEAASDYEKYSALYVEKEAQEQKLTELMERWEALAAEAGE